MIKDYLSDMTIMDMIPFWESDNRRVKFPRLYKLFEKNIVIQPPEIPAERIFSKSGMISNLKRFSLSDSQLCKLSFINFNS